MYSGAARQVWAVNVLGPLRLTRALQSRLVPNARVVMVTSGLGRLSAQPYSLVERLSNPELSLRDLEQLAEEATGGAAAVEDLSLAVGHGEILALLGPSGCGKTTTLRLIAGFELPTTGEIMIQGRRMSDVPAHLRPVNTVFQSYALFPHLNVRDNVAFGLRFQDVPKEEARRQVGKVLELVRLAGFEERRPTQLSGGQQQRVAIARALALRPRLLLADEPTGNLDSRSGEEIVALLERLNAGGLTLVLVTHDPRIASHARRVLRMRDGRIVPE